MSERKPAGATWESWIDRQIECGRAEGLFDDLPGAGKPLPGLDRPHDELWWVREKLRREQIEHLPESLRVRKEVDAARLAMAEARSEAEVRTTVDRINQRIRWVNSHGVEGPPSTVVPFDVDEVVDRWRATHTDLAAVDPSEPALDPIDQVPAASLRRRRLLPRVRRHQR